MFKRAGRASFQLPWVARRGTCAISLDTVLDTDWDQFQLETAYTAAIGLTKTCVEGQSRLGGKTAIGPRKKVILMVFGRDPSPRGNDDLIEESLMNRSMLQEAASPASVLNSTQPGNDIEQRTPRDSPRDSPDLERKSSTYQSQKVDTVPHLEPTLAKLNGSSIKGGEGLEAQVECYEPPRKHERLFPINMSDCKQAARQLVGHRKRIDDYIFSRREIEDPFLYRLPVKLTYGGCAVVLDMESDRDESVMALGSVESAALELARRCSGEVSRYFRFGGKMIAGGRGTDPITLNIYGILPRSSGPASALLLSPNRSTVVTQ